MHKRDDLSWFDNLQTGTVYSYFNGSMICIICGVVNETDRRDCFMIQRRKLIELESPKLGVGHVNRYGAPLVEVTDTDIIKKMQALALCDAL